ncbi:MAG: 3-deoxy-D-manno-octulosonate 8-phosphate phosphatase [Saprospiraceae bacterium]|nr:3-deoxy-D-manno-octulosonate 8-phosphate phosphatase [Saprospiraceae bacterium]
MNNSLAAFHPIKAFFFDVDGVMTDGSLLVTESGEFLRRMSTRDGFAMKLAIKLGYPIGVITGGSSIGVEKRLTLLGVSPIYSGVQIKEPVFLEYIQSSGLDPTTILYMGDDYPDIEVMPHVGLAACPSDAIPEIQRICTYISPFAGGDGCVRDVIEKTLRIQQKWPYA